MQKYTIKISVFEATTRSISLLADLVVNVNQEFLEWLKEPKLLQSLSPKRLVAQMTVHQTS